MSGLEKKKIEVDMALASGDSFRGYLFLGQDERLSDLMNDVRIFLPFEVCGGGEMVINKSTIVEVVPTKERTAGLSAIVDGNEEMPVKVAEQVLGLCGRYNSALIHRRAQMIKDTLESSDTRLDYILEAVKTAADVLISNLKMEALEDNKK